MQKIQSSLSLRLCILMVILFMLAGCSPVRNDITSIEVREPDHHSLQGLAETIKINNCNGDTEIEQVIRQLHNIEVSRVNSNQNMGVLIDAVTAHFAKDYGEAGEVVLSVAPHTNREFVVAWMFETHSGVLEDIVNQEQAAYSIKISFGVGVVASTNLGC